MYTCMCTHIYIYICIHLYINPCVCMYLHREIEIQQTTSLDAYTCACDALVDSESSWRRRASSVAKIQGSSSPSSPNTEMTSGQRLQCETTVQSAVHSPT